MREDHSYAIRCTSLDVYHIWLAQDTEKKAREQELLTDLDTMKRLVQHEMTLADRMVEHLGSTKTTLPASLWG